MNAVKKLGFFQRNITRAANKEAARAPAMKELSTLMAELSAAHAHHKMDLDLEDALDVAGAGRYQVCQGALMLSTLLAAMLEMIGLAFVLPAAACDLRLSDSVRGLLTSIPNIGVIVSATAWGVAADRLGRKPVLVVSCAAAGALALATALMPTLLSFALCKLAASLFLSCPSSLTFAYQCELLPRRRRDRAVLLCNGLLMLLSTLNPLFGWAVLSSDWRYSLGSLVLRPWRLLTAVYATPLLLVAVWLTTAEESPKFLMTRGRDLEALDVLRKVYEVNTGLPRDSFPVRSLKRSEKSPAAGGEGPEARQSALALLRAPHLKWLALTGFLMFGLFSLLNGLFLFAPDTMNKVLGGGEQAGTVCSLINAPHTNTTSPPAACVDTMSPSTFSIMVWSTLVYGCVVTAGSVTPLSKRWLLAAMFALVGAACLLAGLSTNMVVAGAAMSAMQLTALGIGPLTAYAVHLFPTSLRGTAVGAVMMLGRAGSAAGANAAGYFLARACAPTFYTFTALIFLCCGLSFLLPSDRPPSASTAALDCPADPAAR